MKTLFDSKLNSTSPFFSICIETNNRGATIYRALSSLICQGITSFECIVVDDCSTDETVSEIMRFTSSLEYLNSCFQLSVYENKEHLGGVKNWNSALKFAKGKYIAVLEGDDFFRNDHLKKAYDFLNENPTIGIYATGSQRALRPLQGFINSIHYFQYTYQIVNVSPPSETIFIRLNKEKKSYEYDVVNNSYAPELQLYLTISEDGWDVFHTSENDVYREPSTSFTNMSWKFFDDKFKIIIKYKNHPLVSRKQFTNSFKKQFVLALRRYIVSDFEKIGKPESIKLGLKALLKSKLIPTQYLYVTIFNVAILLKQLKFFALYFGFKKMFHRN